MNIQNFLLNKNDSNYANHIISEIHNFNILYIQNKGIRFNNLKSLEINKVRNSNLLLDDQIDLNNYPQSNNKTVIK